MTKRKDPTAHTTITGPRDAKSRRTRLLGASVDDAEFDAIGGELAHRYGSASIGARVVLFHWYRHRDALDLAA